MINILGYNSRQPHPQNREAVNLNGISAQTVTSLHGLYHHPFLSKQSNTVGE